MEPGGGRGGAEAESLRPLLGFGRRFMRNRALAASGWLMAAVVTAVVALYIVLSALSLSGEQVVERDLGRFQFEADVQNVAPVTPRNAALLPELERAARAGGAADAVTTFFTLDVRPALPNAQYTSYTETDWSRNPVPHRYVMLQGRWPRRPGEVVVVRSMNGALAAPGERLAVLAGHEQFQVVGLADDRFAGYHAILAAPGTFATIGPEALRAFPAVGSFSTRVLWEGGRPERVSAALVDGVVRATGRPREEVATAVAEWLRDGERIARDEGRSVLDRIPAGYAAPSLLLPFLAALAAFGFGQRRLRRSGDTLVAAGVRPGRAAVALGSATAGWLAVALVVGFVLGVVLGLAGRLAVERFGWWAQELSPVPNLVDPLVRLGASAAAACIAGTVVLGRALAGGRRDRAASTRASGRRASGTHIRHGVATLAACVAIVQASRLDDAEPAMVFAATLAVAVLLVTPEVVGLALRLFPRSDPRLRLARQHTAYDRARAAVAVAVLAAILGLPLGYLILLDTIIQSSASAQAPETAPGQVRVHSDSIQPPSSAVLAVVRDRLESAGSPVQIRYLSTRDSWATIQGLEFSGLVLALDAAEDVARVLDRPLTAAERAALADGGMLAWDDLEGGERVLEHATGAGSREVRIPAVDVREESVPRWLRGREGVMLAADARRLDLPVADADVLFTGVSDADARGAQQAVLDAGYDPSQVSIYETPVLYTPQSYLLTAAGMLLLVLLCSVAVSRGQVRTLQRYLGTLVAIGITPGWARQVLLAQSAFLLAVGTAVALVLAIPPVAILAWRRTFYELSIPWGQLAAVIVGFYAAVLLATVLSARRIRASDRAAP